MRRATALLSFLILTTAAAPAGEDPPTLSWIPAAGGAASIVPLDTGRQGAGEPTPLEAPVWYEPLPAISVPLLDGGTFSLDSARGSVLLVDFWASWCAPCLTELPRLQALYSAEKSRGLGALAINAGESAEIARTTASALKLTLPVGTLNRAAGDFFRPRQLPVVVLVDRRGRVRERWDGYQTGLEDKIAARVRELLAEDPAGPQRKLGDVVAGAGALRAIWARELQGSVTGLAVVPPASERAKVAAATGMEVTTIEADGRLAKRLRFPFSVARIVVADFDGNGQAEISGFRPGAKEIASVDLSSGAARSFDTPAHLLDVAAIGAALPGKPGGTLALATVGGLYLFDREGTRARKVEGIAETLAVRRAGPAAAAGLVALGADGTVRAVDPAGTPGPATPVRAGDARLVVDERGGSGFGTASAAVAALAWGRFLPGGAAQVAVVAGGSLILVDPAKKAVVWQARWPGIADVASADLDGDGQDELLVASGRTVSLLSARP